MASSIDENFPSETEKKSAVRLLETGLKDWSTLVNSNALLLLFCLPLVVWIVVMELYCAALARESQSIIPALVVAFGGILPCMLVASVGFSGSVYLHKCSLWDERSSVRRLFSEGIKRNFKRYLLFAAVLWASLTCAVLTPLLYMSFRDIDPAVAGAGITVCVAQSFFVIPVTLISAAQCVFYEDKLKNVLSNSVKLYFLKPLGMILWSALCALPVGVCIILPLMYQLAGWVIFLAAVVSFSVGCWLYRCKKLFDYVEMLAKKAKKPDGI